MTGKYESRRRYLCVRVQRALLRSVLRTLVRWEPIAQPAEGYTIIIGCNAPLALMLGANLKFLAEQDLAHAERVIVVIDCPREALATDVEERMRRRFPRLSLEFVYYSRWQRACLQRIGWAWAYSWLSWSMGLSRVRTRYALLHDFDALLLRRDTLEERYRAIVAREDQYVGVRFYGGNGVVPEDGLVTTFELMFDAAFVRSRFKPIDLFNHVCMHCGRSVDFDTFLYAQSLAGRGSVLPIAEEDMVHPSQLICQFTTLMNAPDAVPAKGNNLPLVPYFLSLGGDDAPLDRHRQEFMRAAGANWTPFFGKRLDVRPLDLSHTAWLRKQAYRLERASSGSVRAIVADYFDALDTLVKRRDEGKAEAAAAGAPRARGQEPAESAGAAASLR